jgi:hypothetical protein
MPWMGRCFFASRDMNGWRAWWLIIRRPALKRTCGAWRISSCALPRARRPLSQSAPPRSAHHETPPGLRQCGAAGQCAPGPAGQEALFFLDVDPSQLLPHCRQQQLVWLELLLLPQSWQLCPFIIGLHQLQQANDIRRCHMQQQLIGAGGPLGRGSAACSRAGTTSSASSCQAIEDAGGSARRAATEQRWQRQHRGPVYPATDPERDGG